MCVHVCACVRENMCPCPSVRMPLPVSRVLRFPAPHDTPTSGVRASGDRFPRPRNEPCPMVLVFGCRQSKIDHIYREEALQAKSKGSSENCAAYSREPDKPKGKPQPVMHVCPVHTHTLLPKHPHPF